MKKLIKFTLAAFLLALFAGQTANAQNYDMAFGIRAGGTNGLTFKGKTSANSALEVILGAYPTGPSLTVLGEAYATPASFVGFYAGGGAHARSNAWNNDRENVFFGPIVYAPDERAFGLDAIFGIEFTTPVLPLAFSLDAKPFVEWTNRDNTYIGYDIGLGAKLAF